MLSVHHIFLINCIILIVLSFLFFVAVINSFYVFTPQYFKGCRDIVFMHGVRMGGWVGGGKKFIPAVSHKL